MRSLTLGAWTAGTAAVAFGQEVCDDNRDNDGDGLQDCADPDCDSDGDGTCDRRDVCVLVADPGQDDGDDDGTGDACDVCPAMPGDGLSRFGVRQVLVSSPGDSPSSVYATDLDGGGDADALYASSASDEVAWLENLGGGAFGPPEVLTTHGDGPQSVYATDLDGDGDADVLYASFDDDEVAWLENLGGGGFRSVPQILTTAGNGPRSVYATDLDGDGDADVLYGSFFDDEVAWLENRGGAPSGPARSSRPRETDPSRCTPPTSTATATPTCSMPRSTATRWGGSGTSPIAPTATVTATACSTARSC